MTGTTQRAAGTAATIIFALAGQITLALTAWNWTIAR